MRTLQRSSAALMLVLLPFMGWEVMSGGRAFTVVWLACAAVATVTSFLIIAGRFMGVFAVCDFWYSWLALFVAVPVLLLFVSGIVVARNREARLRMYSGEYNLRLLGEALIEFAERNEYRLPPAAAWCDALLEHNAGLTRSNFQHPQPELVARSGECHYAFNSALGNCDIRRLTPDTILLFEADGDWNLSGRSELLVNPRGDNYAYVSVLYVNLAVRHYWFYRRGIRTITEGAGMRYVDPKWEP